MTFWHTGWTKQRQSYRTNDNKSSTLRWRDNIPPPWHSVDMDSICRSD